MNSEFDFTRFTFSPVIDLPERYEVYDFTHGYDPHRKLEGEYGIGRYDERRPGMYNTLLFATADDEARDIHIGIDIAAPVGTPVKAFYSGRVYLTDINAADGDYGGTVITEHVLGDRTLWALYGHLSHASVTHRKTGDSIHPGDVVGWVGNREENGGWNAHLHFQLSWVKPQRCDLPGTVSLRDRPAALLQYPDPRLVLGPLY